MSNLDDFFKKRDKKKKTAKSKFSTLDTDEFAKKLEATSSIVNENLDDAAVEQQENEIEFTPVVSANLATAAPTAGSSVQQSTANNNAGEQEEEWKPFDSDENKDYSGLKINIQGWKIEDQETTNDGNTDENEKKTNCPWAAPSQLKKVAEVVDEIKVEKIEEKTPENKTEETTAQTTTTTTTKPTETSANTGGTAYIPPALRRQINQTPQEASKPVATESTNKYIPPYMRTSATSGGSSSGSSSAIPPTSVNYRRPNKSQPNINDALEFPTLDSNVSESTTNPGDKLTNGSSNDKFEMPKRSGNIQPKSTTNMIDLDNKFTALSTNN